MSSPENRHSRAYGVIGQLRNVICTFLFSTAPVWAEPVTVVAFGDSLTQGYGLPAEQGFVPQLAGWLMNEGTEVVMINAGVSGDTTAGGLSRINWTLTPEVDGLIVALGGNDLLRGLDPSLSHANLNGILGIAAEKNLPVLLIGIDAPSNYGSEYKEAFDMMYVELADEHGVALHANFLGALAAIPDREKVLRDFMQADAIHPNAAGVKLIVEDIGPEVLKLIEEID